MDKIKILFVGNGSYLNRGCEAIVRGTTNILRQSFDKPKFVNANFDTMDPSYMPDEKDSCVINKPIVFLKRWSPKWVLGQSLKRINNGLAGDYYFASIRNEVISSDAVLSVGGDNYSLDYGIPWNYILLDSFIHRLEKPLVIWGASIGPFTSNLRFADIMHRHLKTVTAIFVREKRSLHYLAKHGVIDNVYLMSDPAFLMMPEPVSLGELGFEIDKNSIGFNLSPLMAKYVAGNNYEKLIIMASEIIEKLYRATGRNIIFIPHVTLPMSDDYEILKTIKVRLNHDISKFVQLVPNNLNAAKTKWIISQVACLIAARTHATIAAFSSGIPTVSLAYSIKAFGINEDLFGHADYVVKSEDFCPDTIFEKVQLVLSDKTAIEDRLQSKMVQIKKSALTAAFKLKEFVKN